jgi:hypothetical protein
VTQMEDQRVAQFDSLRLALELSEKEAREAHTIIQDLDAKLEVCVCVCTEKRGTIKREIQSEI